MTRKKTLDRARARRREAERAAQKLSALRERLFALSEGGAAERPVVVTSASVIEPHALRTPCPRCEGEVRVAEHTATLVGEVRLRELHVLCRRCGVARSMWFRIVTDSVN